MNFKGIFRGLILAVVLVILMLFIGAALVYFNVIAEKSAGVAVFITAMVGVFFGAFGVARTSEERLLINAMTVAVLFALFVFIISVGVNGGVILHTRTLTLMGGSILASFLGALFGK